MRAIKFIAFFFAGFALANCTTKPILPPGERAQIVDVRVTKADARMGTRNLEEDIRVKTQNAAYRMSETGPKKTLAVSIVRYESADPGRAIIVSTGSSLVTAEIILTDNATGVSSKKEEVIAFNSRPGGIIGAIAASTVDPISDEKLLGTKLAENIMKQVYGEEAFKKDGTSSQSKFAAANYPVTYEEEARRLKCLNLESLNEREKERAEDQDEGLDPDLLPIPEHCAPYVKTNLKVTS